MASSAKEQKVQVSPLGVSLEVEYVTFTKVTRDAESLLFGRSRGSYSPIGPGPPHTVNFEDGGRQGNCAGYRTGGWIKGGQRTATAGSDVVQSGRPIFDEFFQHLWPYIGNNTANVVFQRVKRLWLIRIDQ
ncbi:hypothetical protein TNCV_3779161 [Trichonephila clavipes]|nr:hypothetical protein TNCV_3779161 [Trichonephila clavipes]